MSENNSRNELSRLVKRILDTTNMKSENVIEVIKALSDLEYNLSKYSSCDVAKSILYCSVELIKVGNSTTNRIKNLADIYDELRHYCYPQHLLLEEANINKYVSMECMDALKKAICEMDIENVVKLNNMFKVVLQNRADKENEKLKLKRICDIAKIKEKFGNLNDELEKFKEETKASELNDVYEILDRSNIFSIDINVLRIASLCYDDYDKYQHIQNHIR